MRAWLFGILTAFIIVLVLGTIVYASDDYRESEQMVYINVIVDEGDTLWMIAKSYYNGEVNFREFIYKIKKINNLNDAIIYPGQIIKIPVL